MTNIHAKQKNRGYPHWAFTTRIKIHITLIQLDMMTWGVVHTHDTLLSISG